MEIGLSLLKTYLSDEKNYNHSIHYPCSYSSRGTIYVISQDKSDYYKIGVSSNVISRMTELQIGNPNKLTFLFAYSVTRCFRVEHFLHSFFEKCNCRGEWFALTKEEVAEIQGFLCQLHTLSIESLIETAKKLKISA